MKRLKILLWLVLAVSCSKRKEIYRVNEGAPGSELTAQVGGSSLVGLQERMAQGDIKSTEALVDSLNAAQIPEEQQVLQQWIQKYMEWFNNQSVGNLSLTLADLQEYTSLANIQIQADKPENKRLLKSYFESLCNKIQENKYGDTPLIEALEYTLQTMDSDVFDRDPSTLIRLGNDLLDKLGTTGAVFNENVYPTHRSTLYALHQVLMLIQCIDPSQLKELSSRFKAQIADLKQKAQCYPVRYHVQLLEQSLQRLELGGRRTRLQDILRRVGKGLKGGISLYQGGISLDLGACARTLATLNINTFQSGYRDLQEAFARQGIAAKPWYDWHQDMNHASLLSLENADEYGEFERRLQTLRDKEVAMDKEEDRTALHFGIVQQLCLLALHGPSGEVRHKSIQWLEDLGQPEAWGGDPAVMKGVLDGLAALTLHSQGEEKEEAKKALDSLTASPKVGASSRVRHWGTGRRKAAAVPEPITQWLDGQSLEEKLRALPAPLASPASGGLFSTINRLLREEAPVESPAPAAVQEARQALRAHYQHSDFAQVRSLFEGEKPKHVDSLQCQLMLIEQVKVKADREGQQDDLSTHHERLEWVKTPIALEDLFKSRSTKPDEPGRAIQKVLLVGEA
ncbi:MAG: hypothetical protein MI674_06915, partial [Cytophagales bacterium]|nr:hypothetical protein [Cytophagales bacterium]